MLRYGSRVCKKMHRVNRNKLKVRKDRVGKWPVATLEVAGGNWLDRRTT